MTPKYIHPIEKGWEKLKNSKWLAGILSNTLVEEEETVRGELDLDYELYDVA